MTEPLELVEPPETRDVVLRLREASLGFGDRTLWSGLDLDVHAGEFVAVLGPNGSGKTSLLRTILGQQRLDAGEIAFEGHPVRRGDRRIGYIPQQKLIPAGTPMRARDLVALGVDGHRWGLPLPRALLDPERIDVCVYSPHRASRGRGVRGHTVQPGHAATCTHPDSGLPVTDPASTWAMLGSVVRHPYDLVAAADAIARVPRMPAGFEPAKGRALAAKLERLVEQGQPARRIADQEEDRAQERRLGALLAAAREARAKPERLVRREPIARPKPAFEDDLFEDPAPESNPRGGRR